MRDKADDAVCKAIFKRQAQFGNGRQTFFQLPTLDPIITHYSAAWSAANAASCSKVFHEFAIQ